MSNKQVTFIITASRQLLPITEQLEIVLDILRDIVIYADRETWEQANLIEDQIGKLIKSEGLNAVPYPLKGGEYLELPVPKEDES